MTTKAETQIDLTELARHYQDGMQTISAVLDLLPDCQAKANAALFLDTGTVGKCSVQHRR